MLGSTFVRGQPVQDKHGRNRSLWCDRDITHSGSRSTLCQEIPALAIARSLFRPCLQSSFLRKP